ncbi:MAG: MarR family winged helix-turn-helix transcriptional regulator [Acidobacteriota bacterium]
MSSDTFDFDQQNDPLAQRIAQGLSKLGTALRHQAWRKASPAGLTPTQGQILTLLSSRPGLTLAQVAEALAVRPATASDAVKALASKGLLSKSRQAGDARQLSLHLTRDGQETAAEAVQWPEFLVEAVDELDGDERRVLLRTIVRMISALQQRGQIPTSRMCVTCHHFKPRVHQDPRRPHHCGYVDAPFGDADLRIECAEHEPATAADAERLAQFAFASGTA